MTILRKLNFIKEVAIPHMHKLKVKLSNDQK